MKEFLKVTLEDVQKKTFAKFVKDYRTLDFLNEITRRIFRKNLRWDFWKKSMDAISEEPIWNNSQRNSQSNLRKKSLVSKDFIKFLRKSLENFLRNSKNGFLNESFEKNLDGIVREFLKEWYFQRKFPNELLIVFLNTLRFFWSNP